MRDKLPQNKFRLKRVSVTFRPEEFEILDMVSEALETNRSEVIRRCLYGEATIAELLDGVEMTPTWLPRSFMLPAEDVQLLKIYAAELNLSLSRLIRDTLHETV